ncbi:uncharacterized protein KIAA0232 homolog isoform X2 [Phyllobates terribilis]|uniref:uncharacterized protein KIAA0232 homolog isoform X2 n=1 Tax=Phyllobates terribilis TaxID=111132 RepID=UPI003CCAEDA4
MRPICTVVDGLPSEGTLSSFPGPISVFEMSMLRALDPVQTWLGQELEKCGIDAMIYTRYVLSLLLHDSYDYDLQDQENDIFAGWEKGACKKWGKGKKKSSDLSMEEMKKQAAVQCLLSASDESSGIETLVEELCSKLKDLQSSQGDQLTTNKEEKSNKKVDGSLSPEATSSPARKDQAEMYYEAFPPLSEKSICLQEIMTVWNKSKICSYSSSSSSSTAPQTSTETPSPKNCHSESEAIMTQKNNAASNTVQGKNQQRKGKSEKENKFSNGAADEKTNIAKSVRHKSNGKSRPRSWSSGSSEAGSSSSGNLGEAKARFIKVRHKVREVRNKKGKTGPKVPSKNGERKNVSAGSGAVPVKPICKKVKRQGKEYAYKEMDNEGSDVFKERRNKTAFREEPLWYTEPITEYFIPLNSKSKLETTYRKNRGWYNASEEIEELSEFVKDLHLNHNIHETYLAAGTFIEGHFVEMPAVVTKTSDHTGTSNCSLLEDNYLDDVHPAELTHFYEVEIDQSMLDPGASEKTKGESRILNMIRQKSNLKSDLEAESCKVLDDKESHGESAIWTESTSSIGAEGFFLQDHSRLAQFWESCSPSSSADADGESLGGDSPSTFSPFYDSTKLHTHMQAGNQDLFFDGNNSYFSVFEVQCSNSVFSMPSSERAFNEKGGKAESSSSTNGFGKTQSRLLIWTKNSAFDDNEQCSNISTRTCSPWSHSEGTRSDAEALNSYLEDYAQLNSEDTSYIIPTVTLSFQDDIPGVNLQSTYRTLGDDSVPASGKKSKLESLCGIQLEQENEEISETTEIDPKSGIHQPGYSSGVLKDLWTNVEEDPLFPLDVNSFSCHNANETEEEPRKAVQRSEYHLWESQRHPAEKRAFLTCDSTKLDSGDYMTPSKPWDINHAKENSFILGGVYGEFGSFNGEDEWAVVPQGPAKASSLLDSTASDVVTIAGTDVFMTPGNSIAPGHRQLWRPFVSFEENEQNGNKGSSKGFSFILHENLLGTCDNIQMEEPGMGYSFSSFDLNSRFSQVLHVECSFEPGNIVSSSPTSRTKALCSDPEGDVSHPRICGVDRTQYRSIRISPRTHFRPISASELSPGVGSESDFESEEKDEVAAPTLSEGETFEDPQDDLKPLEEDAEKESNFFGKSELESGKFLPRLQKSGMEKSAQTSLDGQEEACAVLPQEDQDNLDFRIIESCESDVMANCKESCKTVELKSKADVKENLNTEGTLALEEEYPSLSINLQGINAVNEKQCWWQKALYSPLISGSCCDPLYTDTKEESCVDHKGGKDIPCAAWHPLEIEKTSACNKGKITIDFSGAVTSSCFRKIYSSDSSSSDTASEGGHEWADICREELFSRTQL